jgi:cytochrome c-type biogenesis protein CcmH/NrfG
VPKESVVFGIAGVLSGLLVGWMIGSQQGRPPAAAAAQPSTSAQAQTAKPFDESRAAALRAAIEKDRNDVESRVQLGNLFFDAERFPEAAKQYEDGLAINPKHINASTDLGIAYYYMNQPDRALAQFDRSLAIDATHTKTLLNIGIVRAFGKQDLEGAATVWQKVVDLAPGSDEAALARQALQSLRSAHPEGTSRPAATPPK